MLGNVNKKGNRTTKNKGKGAGKNKGKGAGKNKTKTTGRGRKPKNNTNSQAQVNKEQAQVNKEQAQVNKEIAKNLAAPVAPIPTPEGLIISTTPIPPKRKRAPNGSRKPTYSRPPKWANGVTKTLDNTYINPADLVKFFADHHIKAPKQNTYAAYIAALKRWTKSGRSGRAPRTKK